MISLKKTLEKLKNQEENRIGNVYNECEKRGCPSRFAKAFNTRAELFPEKQTRTFLEQNNFSSEYLKWWKVYIEVLIENLPNHEKINEWKQCIKLIEKEGVK